MALPDEMNEFRIAGHFGLTTKTGRAREAGRNENVRVVFWVVRTQGEFRGIVGKFTFPPGGKRRSDWIGNERVDVLADESAVIAWVKQADSDAFAWQQNGYDAKWPVLTKEAAQAAKIAEAVQAVDEVVNDGTAAAKAECKAKCYQRAKDNVHNLLSSCKVIEHVYGDATLSDYEVVLRDMLAKIGDKDCV